MNEPSLQPSSGQMVVGTILLFVFAIVVSGAVRFLFGLALNSRIFIALPILIIGLTPLLLRSTPGNGNIFVRYLISAIATTALSLLFLAATLYVFPQ